MKKIYGTKEFIKKFSKEDYEDFNFMMIQEILQKINYLKEITKINLAILIANLVLLLFS